MPKEQKKRSKRLLRTIPVFALAAAILVALGDIRPEMLRAAFGYKIIVWVYVVATWTAIVAVLYYATKDVGRTNAEIEADK